MILDYFQIKCLFFGEDLTVPTSRMQMKMESCLYVLAFHSHISLSLFCVEKERDGGKGGAPRRLTSLPPCFEKARSITRHKS